MEAKIDLNDEQFEKAMQYAILAKIDSIGRDEIIAQAVTRLTTLEESVGGRKGETPLMKAFNRATSSVMDQIVREEVGKKDSEFRLKITEVVEEGVKLWLEKVIHGQEQSLPSKISAAIEKALIPDGSYY
jgi:hypothetical protein